MTTVNSPIDPARQAYLDYVEAGRKTAEDQRQSYLNYLESGRQTNLASSDVTTVTYQKALDAQYGNTPGAANTNPTTPSTADVSAKATIMSTLSRYGLETLGDFAWQEYLKDIPIEQILLDIRNTNEYKTRFPAMSTLASRGQGISETQYINYENTVKNIMHSAGLPEGFYDSPSDFSQFLIDNVSPDEINSRVTAAKTAVYQSDPATLEALQNFYGAWGNSSTMVGDLTAYFLDDQKAVPLIQQQLIAAQEAGAASRTGYGVLGQTEAERLATLGVTADQAQQGFGTLANIDNLFSNLPGEAGTAPTREQGLQAAFENNAEAQQAIKKRQQSRNAPFQQGGGFQTGQTGISGLT